MVTVIEARQLEPLDEDDARRVSTALAHASSDEGIAQHLVSDGEEIDLPPVVRDAVHDLLVRFARGEAVIIASADQLLTTSQAGEVIGVSRTYICRLLDEGRLRYEHRGTHRRIRLRDAVEFSKTREREQQRALDRIAEVSRDAGLYDDEF